MTLGVVDILIARKPAEHGLPKKSHEEMSDVLAVPRLRQDHSTSISACPTAVLPPWSLCHVPTGGGGSVEGTVPENPEPD